LAETHTQLAGECFGLLGCAQYNGFYGVPIDDRKAFETFTKGTRFGDKLSMYWLGIMYENGHACEQDFVKAFELFNKAAQAGHQDARFKVAMYCKYGTKGNVDMPMAITQLSLNLADPIHLQSCFELAKIYVEMKEYDTADGLFKVCTNAFYLDAFHEYGNLYLTHYAKREGITQKDRESCLRYAKQLYRNGADMGCTECQYAVANLYMGGVGTTKNLQKAFTYYKLAADKNHVNAIVELAMRYFKGEGIEKNDKKAFELFTKATDMGSDWAYINLAIMHYFGKGTPQNYSVAYKILEQYAESTAYADISMYVAFYYLGRMYYFGQGVSVDYKRAADLFAKSAKNGSKTAKSFLARQYELGRGVEKDLKKAIDLYMTAEIPYELMQKTTTPADEILRIISPQNDKIDQIDSAIVEYGVEKLTELNKAKTPTTTSLTSKFSNFFSKNDSTKINNISVEQLPSINTIMATPTVAVPVNDHTKLL
jgi:TPR repeat protein